MVCTYPPSIWSELENLPLVMGTPIFPLSAARMSRESASCEDPEVITSSIVSFDTAARSMSLRSVPTSSRILSASSASFRQYLRTFSLSLDHSASMYLGSTSSFCSPRSCRDTALSVSCLGLSSFFTAHHASHIRRPLILQNLSLTIRGCPPSLPQGRASCILLALALSIILRMS